MSSALSLLIPISAGLVFMWYVLFMAGLVPMPVDYDDTGVRWEWWVDIKKRYGTEEDGR